MSFYFTFTSTQKDVISAETSAEPVLLQRVENIYFFKFVHHQSYWWNSHCRVLTQGSANGTFLLVVLQANLACPCGQHGLEFLWRPYWLKTQLCSVLIYWSWSVLPEELIPWASDGNLRELFSALYLYMGRERAGHCRLILHQIPVRLDVMLMVWTKKSRQDGNSLQTTKEN